MFRTTIPYRDSAVSFILFVLLLLPIVSSGAIAPSPDNPDQNTPADKYKDFITILKSKGYTVLARKKALYFKHERAINFMFREYRSGYLLTSTYQGSAYGKSHLPDFLKLCNTGNSMATVAKFYLDKDNDFIMEAWYGGPYDKKRFGDFIDTWNNDWLMLYRRAKDKMVKMLK